MLSEEGVGRPDAGRAGTQLRQVLVLGVAVLVLAAGTGWLAGLDARRWLVLGLCAALVLWVGGAVSGQVLLARLLDLDRDGRQILDYLRQLLWIIPRCYVPSGFVALGCGLGLVAVTGTAVATPAVLVPLGLYALTAVAGSAISAPGYVRLIRLAETAGADHPDVRRRLLPLAWVNRVELALVVGVGFVLLAGPT